MRTSYPKYSYASICLFLVSALFTQPIYSQQSIIDFESDQWDLQNAQIVEHLDRKCVIGNAFLKDVEFENGVIEVDIAVDGSRSYPGILFRMESEENYERFYIRPHRPDFYADNLQYVPAFNGIDGWQLYNGENYTAGVPIPTNQWIHFKIEVHGTQARVFMNDITQPVLSINYLKRGISKGTLGVVGPLNKTSYFSNFSYSVNNALHFEPVPPIETIPGVITDWEISQPFPYSQIDMEKHFTKQDLGVRQWQKINPEPNGLVDISRITGRTGNEPDGIIAKTNIQAAENHTMQLLFGYSDVVTIFLNGQLLFYGNSAYTYRDPSFLGIIGYYDAVYLPLKKGQNELLLYIMENSGGWGFMCRDGNAEFVHPSMEKLWEINEPLRMPESVVHDEKRGVLYISNFDAFGTPGQQFISKASLDGKLLEPKWVDGLTRPLGLVIHNDKLYVVERRNLAEIDLQSATVIQRYPFPNPNFPNDVTADNKGNFYVTDTRKKAIYKLSNGVFEEWFAGDEIDRPNGVAVYKDQLLVGTTGRHTVLSFDLNTRQPTTLITFGEGLMDGIQSDNDGNFIIGHYEGRIYRITPTGEKTLLLYTAETNCADYLFLPKKDLLIIPTLESGKVMAYQLVK